MILKTTDTWMRIAKGRNEEKKINKKSSDTIKSEAVSLQPVGYY